MTNVMHPITGWQPDPTGRHEGRYFVSGHPTDLIRDGNVESVDPEGEHQLESHDATYEYPGHPSRRSRSRWLWSVAAVVGVLVAAAGATAAVLLNRESPDERYLAALREAELSGQFASDANAVAHGKQVCRTLEEGGAQQGLPVDKVAVDAYCPKFSGGFHVLQTVTVTGTFTLIDSDPGVYYPSIISYGSTCWGSNGYSDIQQGTQVVVKNGKGETLATTSLGSGTGTSNRCEFPVSFDITEGQDRYVVSTGRRGEISYSFTELKNNGLTLTLGQ